MADHDWAPDILGAGYGQRVLDLGADPDGEGTVGAVLVRREPRPGDAPPRGAVLYVHGFSDYFFQTQLADFFGQRGFPFYAVELRKSGRARRHGQTAHYVTDLARHDEELDRALACVAAAHPGAPVLLVAHSTGGLTVPLWLHRRRAAGKAGQVAGLVLNSPWFDLQGSWVLRGPVTQLLRPFARIAPSALFRSGAGRYGRTLHVSTGGEWDFDVNLKPLDGFPVALGWLNAVRRGHARLHRGLDIGVPGLVLHSTRSDLAREDSGLGDRADLVLDVTQIARWAGSLGGDVTVVAVQDARHDVFLSLPQARERAYAALDSWLGRHLPAAADGVGAAEGISAAE
jgi:alpha-beta hydrolase superfamily lysophospholipase